MSDRANDSFASFGGSERWSDVVTNRPIEVILPATLDVAPMLRLICAQLGTEAGFSLDEVDDLRLVATEVFSSAVDVTNAERISITFEALGDGVSAMFFAVGPAAIELDELAMRILRSGVDEIELTAGTVRFVKRTAPG